MILYNLFPLLAGPFPNWKPHLDRAAAMGFDWVFVNPIQKSGLSGSLYSISDYFAMDPRLVEPTGKTAPEEQARQIVEYARSKGLKVMIDLVINHCAIDSAITREHPEWFEHESDGSIAHAFALHDNQKVVWGDLAKFDHRHTRDQEGLYRFCLRVVEYLLALGFEGFRCDAAYQLPHHFWHRLIQEIKAKHPNVCFTAETLGCTADQTKDTARAGFQFVFNSSKYWNFHDWWLIEQYNLTRETCPSISFPESHDTVRLCAEVNGNVDALKQRYLFAALFSAGVMMPIGFEYGFRRQVHVVSTKPTDWETPSVDLCDFIGKVNAIKKRYPIFNEESPLSIIPYQNPNILLMWKGSSRHRDEALLILNKDPWNKQEFYSDNLRQYVQAGGPLYDASPDYRMDYVHQPFHYVLRPGQGIVLVATRT